MRKWKKCSARNNEDMKGPAGVPNPSGLQIKNENAGVFLYRAVSPYVKKNDLQNHFTMEKKDGTENAFQAGD